MVARDLDAARKRTRRPSEEARYRRALLLGCAISLMAHGGVLLLWRGGPGLDSTETSRSAPRDAFAARALRAVQMAEPEEIPAPPAPVETPEAPEWVPPGLSSGKPVASVPLLSGGARIARRPPGSQGIGSRAPAGTTGRSWSPPVPRSVFPEWEVPARLRGSRITLRIQVDARGRPTGAVELHPPTADPDFNRRLVDRVSRMEFYPARRAGRSVEGWAEITFVF